MDRMRSYRVTAELWEAAPMYVVAADLIEHAAFLSQRELDRCVSG